MWNPRTKGVAQSRADFFWRCPTNKMAGRNKLEKLEKYLLSHFTSLWKAEYGVSCPCGFVYGTVRAWSASAAKFRRLLFACVLFLARVWLGVGCRESCCGVTKLLLENHCLSHRRPTKHFEFCPWLCHPFFTVGSTSYRICIFTYLHCNYTFKSQVLLDCLSLLLCM